jgi:serine protease AprX
LRDIIRRNPSLPNEEKVRAVSISTGTFSSYSQYEEWEAALEEAKKAGIFVMTCDRDPFPYATLAHIQGMDPDDFRSYRRGYYGVEDPALMIPAGNRTIASHRGPDVYTFDRMGGMSWASPYVAGLAALAFQVDPKLDPSKIWDYLVRTAVKTEAGPVINPAGFIDYVKKLQVDR